MKQKQTVYSFVVVFNPAEGSKKKAQILKSGLELATSEKILGMKLVRALDKKWAKELENIEIIVSSIYSGSYSSPYYGAGSYGTLTGFRGLTNNAVSSDINLNGTAAGGTTGTVTFTANSLKNN